MKHLRQDRGLTLVELVLAVAVLSLLTVLAAPRVQAAIEASREAKVARELHTIQTALEQHFLDHGYYPDKLNELIERGYLKNGTTFKSPSSGHYYFYVVDDNRGRRARAYALGAPKKSAGPENKLYRGRPLPKGRRPDWRALAWLHYEAGKGITLYQEDDKTPLSNGDPFPTSLSGYRTSCLPSSPSPCDLLTE